MHFNDINELGCASNEHPPPEFIPTRLMLIYV